MNAATEVKAKAKAELAAAAVTSLKIDSSSAYIERHLTASQKQKLTKNLKPLSSELKILKVFADDSPDSSRYASEFVQIFDSLGIDPLGPVPAGSNLATDRGVTVGVVDSDHPSDLSTRFIAALRGADIEVNVTKWVVGKEKPAGPRDFDLFIYGK